MVVFLADMTLGHLIHMKVLAVTLRDGPGLQAEKERGHVREASS